MGQNCTYECNFSEILQDIDEDPLDIVCRKKEEHLMYSTLNILKIVKWLYLGLILIIPS